MATPTPLPPQPSLPPAGMPAMTPSQPPIAKPPMTSPQMLGAPQPPMAGQAGAAALPPVEIVVPQPGFLQQPWVQTVLPFVTSLVVHAVIIVLGLTLFVTVVQEGNKIIQEEQTIIPESTMADAGPPGGVPNVGANGDPFKQAMQDTTPDGGTPEGWANKQSPNVDPAAAGGGDSGADANVIGLGMGSLGGGKGIGTGKGGGTGGGAGEGGPLGQFGMPGGGAIGPKGPVFGNGGNARKIVFVCDATGTMINKLGTLKHELQKAVQALSPIQAYNVVFYTDGGKFHIADKNGLIMANLDNKRNTQRFLDDITPTGTTDPVPGLEAAFKQQPQLLYFLSDGEFNNLKSYKEVTDAISRFNKDKKVKVNTILFETFEPGAEEVMKQIAAENGGSYRYVREADLQ